MKLDPNKIYKLLSSGLHPREVAKKLGCQTNTIKAWKSRLGLTTRVKQIDMEEFQRRLDDGEDLHKIAEAMGCSWRTLQTKIRIAKEDYGPSVDYRKQLDEFVSQVAADLGFEPESVRKEIRNEGPVWGHIRERYA